MTTGSAGFIGPGRTPPPEALEAAFARGLDTSEHRSRLVTTSLLADADVVVVMDAPQLRRVRRLVPRGTPVVVLGDLDPGLIPRRTIRDPWGYEGDVFDAVFERIDRCVDELVASLDHGGRPPAPGATRRDHPETEEEAYPCSPTTSR